MKTILLMGLGWGEILVLVLLIIVLFGAKKIPELMKSVGKGVRSFKDGLDGVDEQENLADKEDKK